MKIIWNWMQTAIMAVDGVLGWFFGGLDGLLYALIVFAVLDYITGVICAIIDKNLSSEIGYKGILKKVLIFIVVGVANTIDVKVIGSGNVLRLVVIMFYLTNEGVSLLENIAHAGLPVPAKLKEVLEQLHNKNEEDNK